MEKQITYRKLMKMVEEGDALIVGYDSQDEDMWLVETYDREGRAVRKAYRVKGTPVASRPEASI